MAMARPHTSYNGADLYVKWLNKSLNMRISLLEIGIRECIKWPFKACEIPYDKFIYVEHGIEHEIKD